MKMHLPILIFTALLGGLAVASPATIKYDLNGQISAWHVESSYQDGRYFYSGIRYIPLVLINPVPSSENLLDLELSINTWASTGSLDRLEETDLSLYRLKLRYATLRTETRAGLQKINFGPAWLLRSLRWFDRLDPRDPLGLTEAVYALRFKYDSPGNAGLWLWTLYGNDDPKGFEILPTVRQIPEFGGRYQHPVPAGELAATLHTRRVAGSSEEFTENRYALDGRWDIGVGLWAEAVWQQQFNSGGDDWLRLYTLGLDYTFGLGSGLHLLVEHQAIAPASSPFSWTEDYHTSALSMNYSPGILDNLSVFGFYSWDSNDLLPYASWQRSWDNLILNVSVFYNPRSFTGTGLYKQTASAEGLGGQIIVAYNH